jgi:hypothetical protein
MYSFVQELLHDCHRAQRPLVQMRVDRSLELVHSRLLHVSSFPQQPACPVGSILLALLNRPEIIGQFQLVDVSHLTESMIFTAQVPFAGLRVSDWIELPGKSGRFVRPREVTEQANREILMDFQNNTVPDWPYIITLDPGDALVWCPGKYIWPACMVCKKFLSPCEDHRNSDKHRSKCCWWWQQLHALSDLERTRSKHAAGFVQNNWRGLSCAW